MKKAAAFSMIDVVVTLIISMLVMGIAFTVFEFSYKQIYSYKDVNDDYKELYQLYTVMQEDFQRASEIKYDNHELQMLMQTQKKYNYLLFDEMIIRKTELSSDTFFVDVQNIRTLFKTQEQSSGLIDELNFTLTKGDVELPYKFIKQYSAEMYMELEENR